MLKQDLQHLACPACGMARFEHRTAKQAHPLPPGFDSATMLWEGDLVCGHCGAEFPLLEGVACLAVFDQRWRVPFKEAESRISLFMRVTEPQAWEGKREETYTAQEQQVGEVMDFLFKVALEQIDFSKKPLILDVGCGDGRTTNQFTIRGGRAFGVDVDLAMLRYLSFKGVDELPPYNWRHPVSGHVFHDKEPRAIEHYFTRVFSDVARLPFAPATFDYVFCRSVLHHLDDHPTVMREMARVLKPGGRMIFCSEPIRSVLTDEQECMIDNVYCEEGMNERVWPAWRFLGPIWSYSRNILLHTWPNRPPTKGLRRKTFGLASWLHRRIGSGARLKGLKLLAAPFVEAAVNIYATRNRKPMPRAMSEAAVTLPADDLREFVELYRVNPHSEGEGVYDLPRKRAVIGKLRRKLLAGESDLPMRLELAGVPQHELDRGWLVTRSHEGRLGRPIAREADCTLRREAGKTQIQLTCALSANEEALLEFSINDVAAGQARLAKSSWSEVEFPIPGAITENVLNLRLRISADSDTQLIVSEIRQAQGEIIQTT